MTDNFDDDCDVTRGSGNVFRDLGHPDADREQLRAILAARIAALHEQDIWFHYDFKECSV